MPPKGPLRGALKNKGEKVYTTQSGASDISLTPGTFYTSSATGIGKRGIDLHKCYNGEQNTKGQRHGYGAYRYANGYITYEGEYVNGVKHGRGRLTFKDGGYYEGRFEYDEINGQGTRRFANGNTWTGMFEIGDMHGQGTMAFKNGDTYEGNMVKNKMHGSAMFKFRKGDAYRGDFTDNEMTGQGVMTYRCGDRYKGEWLKGKRHGRGRCSYANGDHYTGSWQNDKYHGQGCLVLASQGGIRYEGLFENGAPTLLPTKLNVFWMESEQDVKARITPKKAPPNSKAQVDEPPVILQNTLGTPLQTSLTIAAQLLQPATLSLPIDTAASSACSTSPVPVAAGPAPPASPAPVAASPATVRGTEAAQPAAPVGPQPVMTERAPAGSTWQTSDMEYGRVVHLTLHHSAPQPATEDRPVGLQMVSTQCSDGSVQLRLLLGPYHLGSALPMCRKQEPLVLEPMDATETSSTVDNTTTNSSTNSNKVGRAASAAAASTNSQQGVPVHCLELVLEQGQHVLHNLKLGEIADFAALQCNDGVGYLVASCGWGLQPGYCRIALPDAKAKNSNPPAPDTPLKAGMAKR